MSKEIVQIESSSISFGQVLYGAKNQMLMLFGSKVEYFSYPERVIQVQV